jgi:hypothetical protein
MYIVATMTYRGIDTNQMAQENVIVSLYTYI